MTYELRLERLYDAPPEVVFDAFTDPANQAELHGEGTEGWPSNESRRTSEWAAPPRTRWGLQGSSPTSRRACAPWWTGRTGWSSGIP